MPKPELVNPKAFKVDVVLYDYNDFSVVYGIWTESSSKRLAMRWNDSFDGNGYPKTFGNPQWFIVSDDLARNILLGLLSSPHITIAQYLLILDTLKVI